MHGSAWVCMVSMGVCEWSWAKVECSTGVLELSSRKVEWSSGVVEWSRVKVEWSSGVVEWSSGVVEWSSEVVEWSSGSRLSTKSCKENPKSGQESETFYNNFSIY